MTLRSLSFKSSAAVLALGCAVLSLESSGALARDPSTPDWPCVQRKVAVLTSTQLWDGPPVEELTAWRNDESIRKLLPGLASRRVPIEEAAAAIKKFAESQPEGKRDEALKLLFAGLVATINDDRKVVLAGIERFQQRQRGRAAEIEREGLAINELKVKAERDEKARAELAQAEERFNWDSRIFTERQQNLPLACEIPVLIEQRIFDLGREIRAHMKN